MAYHELTWADQTYTSTGQQTSTSTSAGRQDLNSLNTQSNALDCYQSSKAVLYAGGQYGNGSWALSSYNLTAASATTATQGRWSGGSSTASGVNTSGQSTTGTGSSGLSQVTYQAQSGTVTERGAYGGGSLALSLVSFTAQGTDSFTYANASNDSYTGPTSGNDSSTVTASGQGSYTATGQGSWTPAPHDPYTGATGQLSLSSFTLTGGATGSYNLVSSGRTGSTPYGHGDAWNETTTLSESGTYGPSAGWAFTNYHSSTNSTETLSDLYGGDGDNAVINDNVAVSDVGGSGVSVETASGSYRWDLQTTTLNATTLATAVALPAGPGLPGLNPGGNPVNWMLNPGNGLWTPVSSLTSIAGQLTGAPSGSAVAALVQAAPTATAGGLAPPAPSPPMMMGLGLSQTPPLLAGLASGPVLTPTGYANLMTPGYAAGFASRGWLGPLAGNAALIGAQAAQPWSFLGALTPDLWTASNQAYAGALAHVANPPVGQAQALFQAMVARVHGVPSLNGYALWARWWTSWAGSSTR